MTQKRLLLILLVFGVQSISFGQSVILGIGSGSGTAGSTIDVPITLASSGGAQTAGLQWSFSFSSDITSVTVVAGTSATNAGKSVTCSGNNCLILGFNSTAMADGTVAIATFHIASSPSTTLIPVQITNVVASTAAGSSIAASGGMGTITLPGQTPTGVSVGVSPSTVTLTASQTKQFTATVTGSANTSVTWSMNPSIGTLVNGLYTAPSAINTAQSVTVTATSVADTSKSGSAVVQLGPPGTISISVNPPSSTLTTSQTTQFTATVTGNANTSVTWSMNPSIGTLVNGLYTAPSAINSTQPITVTATSVADTSKSASATVQLVPAGGVIVSVSPLNATLTQSQSKQFTATVTGNANAAVTWSMTPSVGTLSNGLYTAPAVISGPLLVSITATSVADPSRSGSATVTLAPPANGVSVSLSPLSAALTPSQHTQFTATVTGNSNTSVTWSMSPSIGTLVNGSYTAPSVISATQSLTVTATSVADVSKSASATIQLMPSAPPGSSTVKITSPSSEPTFVSSQNPITLGGTASSNTAQVVWATDQGIQGQALGTTDWAASGITLRNGSNRITVTARDTSGNQNSVTVTVVFSAPVIVTTSLSNAQLGKAYSSKLAAAGGTQPYTWTITSVPAGLTVSADGAITGTPSAAGTFTLNVRLQDSLQMVASATVKLRVDDGLVLVSAASQKPGPVAPDSMVTLFGGQLAGATQSATQQPLPTTLGDCTVKVKDANGVERSAGLFYVSPNQINFKIPTDTAAGPATITVTSGDQTQTLGTLNVAIISPGLFFLNSDGLAAADLTRVSGNNTSYEEVAQLDRTTNLFVAVPIDLGSDTDKVYLTLYGTGFRNRPSLDSVRVLVANMPALVDYAGPSATSEGLDLVHVLLPKELGGMGTVTVVVTVNGVSSNGVRILIK